MNLTLELPIDLEQELSVEADRLGLPLPEYAVRLLYSRQNFKNMPKTGAELVRYWEKVDVVGTRSDITDSQTYARQLRTDAENRA